MHSMSELYGAMRLNICIHELLAFGKASETIPRSEAGKMN